MSKVAVFGDAMLDIYLHGRAKKLSAEAPIPVLEIETITNYPGGAGNVVANLKALDVEVIDCTSAGPVKNRLVVGDHQIARWDVNDHCKPWEGTMPEDIDAVVISDYNKGGVPRNVQWPRDIPMFVDTKLSPNLYPSWAFFFPNQAEYDQYEEEYDSKSWVILKRGEKGLTLVNEGFPIVSQAAGARFVRSVNGAGDTVLAAFVARALKFPSPKPAGWLNRCLDYASTAAAIAVEKPLTAVVTASEITIRGTSNVA